MLRPLRRRLAASTCLKIAGGAFAVALFASAADAQATPAAAPPPETAAARAAPTPPEAAAPSTAVAEVLVTARLRSENIEKVPVAITYLDGDALRSKQILQYTDLQREVPALTIPTGYASSVQSIYIRGYAATTYFSEVPIPMSGANTLMGAINPLYDISSIQVLKGPQGTLFGATSLGGAVLITPSHPDLEKYQAGVDVILGDYSHADLNAYVNIPLVKDQLGVRIAVERQHTDGYTSVIGSNVKLDEVNNVGFRVGVDWRPGAGRFENYTMFSYFNEDQKPASRFVGGVDPGNVYFNLPASIAAPGGAAAGAQYYGAICAGAVANRLASDVLSCENQHLGVLANLAAGLKQQAARVAMGGDEARRIEQPINPALPIIQKAENISFTDISSLDLGSLFDTKLSVKNIFNYFLFRSITTTYVGQDTFDYSTYGGATDYVKSAGGQPGGFGLGGWDERYSDEFQLHGDTHDGLLVWVLGAYAAAAPTVMQLQGSNNFNLTFAGANTQNFGFVFAVPFNLGGWATQYGEYAQGTLDLGWLLHGVHFTAGVRESQSLTIANSAAPVYNYGAGTVAPGLASRVKTTSDGLGWTFALDYQANRDLLLYATARRAYIPGGVNPIKADATGLPGYTPTYHPTLLTDYEIGAKYDFHLLGTRGRVNVDAYNDSFDDIVVPIIGYTVAGGLLSFNENAASATKRGVEFTLDWFPIDHVEIKASYAYQDAHYDQYYASDPLSIAKIGSPLCDPTHSTATTCILDLKSNPLYTSPENQFNVSLLYTLPLPEDYGKVVAGLSVSGQSRSYFTSSGARDAQAFGPAVAAAVSQGAYAVANLRIDWRQMFGTDVSAAAYVTNLTNELYKDGGFDSLPTLGVASVNYAAPRMFGVELSYRFGGR